MPWFVRWIAIDNQNHAMVSRVHASESRYFHANSKNFTLKLPDKYYLCAYHSIKFQSYASPQQNWRIAEFSPNDCPYSTRRNLVKQIDLPGLVLNGQVSTVASTNLISSKISSCCERKYETKVALLLKIYKSGRSYAIYKNFFFVKESLPFTKTINN